MDFFPFDDDYVRRLREGDRWTEEHFHSYFEQLLLIKLRRRLPSLRGDSRTCGRKCLPAFSRSCGRPAAAFATARKLGAYVNTVCNNVVLEQYRRPTAPSRSLTRTSTSPPRKTSRRSSSRRGARARPPRGQRAAATRDRDILKALFFDETAEG